MTTVADILSGSAVWHLNEGDSELLSIPPNSVDALITDPPAGISFMAAEWDSDKGGEEQWIAWLARVLRVAYDALKPGAMGAVWALPRTVDWTMQACRRAGFDVRDILLHCYSSGFPKSSNISKLIDAAAGARREVIGSQVLSGNAAMTTEEKGGTYAVGALAPGLTKTIDITAAATPEARRFDGFGTALKPAQECWIIIRKPVGVITSEQIRAATGWDWWHTTRRADTVKQRAKVAAKHGITVPDGGECEARTLKALHAGVESYSEVRWREAVYSEPEGEETDDDDDGADEPERIYQHAGEWRVLWTSARTAYKSWKTSSIAACALVYGTGGINVDAGRVGDAGLDTFEESLGIGLHKGRWPANIAYSHAQWDESHCPACNLTVPFAARFCSACGGAVETRRAGCECVGERKVRTGTTYEPAVGAGHVREIGNAPEGSLGRITGYADPDGTETIPLWECLATCDRCGTSALVLSGAEAGPCSSCATPRRWSCPKALLDEQSGVRKSGAMAAGTPRGIGNVVYGAAAGVHTKTPIAASEGGGSRFFHIFPPDPSEPFLYSAKPSTAEREYGLSGEAGFDALPRKGAADLVHREAGSAGTNSPRAGAGRRSEGRANTHTTVKGFHLIQHLAKLLIPPGGVVLDLFGGSGTLGAVVAHHHQATGWRVIMSELDDTHCAIIRERCRYWGLRRVTAASKPIARKAPKIAPGQGSLF